MESTRTRELGTGLFIFLGLAALLFLATQKDQAIEAPEPDDIFSVGTVALILRMLKLPDGRLKILVLGKARARVEEYLQERPKLTTTTLQWRSGNLF